jgi:hypothetical protein
MKICLPVSISQKTKGELHRDEKAGKYGNFELFVGRKFEIWVGGTPNAPRPLQVSC